MADTSGSITTQYNMNPEWLQQATQQIGGAAMNVAGQNYTPYTAPTNASTYGINAGTIAGLTPQQQAAQQGIIASQGAYNPAISYAADRYDQAKGVSEGIASWVVPYYNSAKDSSGQALGAAGKVVGNAQGAYDTASGTLGKGVEAVGAVPGTYQGGFANAAGTTNQAISATNAVPAQYQKYLEAAGGTIPQNIDKYMNPYTDSVVKRIEELGNRNLAENLMPSVNSTFAGAGQFGSTRNANFTNQALRNTQDAILGQQSTALQSGYQNAAQNAATDLARQLDIGKTAGSLGYQGASLLGTLGQNQADQANALGNLGYKGAEILAGIGNSQSSLANNQGQLALGSANLMNQISQNQANQGNAIGQLGISNANLLNNIGTNAANLGQQAQNMNYTDLGALNAVGVTNQTLNQANMDKAYADFVAQRDYQKNQIDWAKNAVTGLPINTTQSRVNSNAGAAGSTLSPLVAAGQAFTGAYKP